ncbi:MAG TPA: Fur family transcriptional regulator [Saprospiraceae bacterium]|nr:Fur family transcriptional regulator [Saprospiraceae bacterium]
MYLNNFRDSLKAKGLKVTPQRVMVFQAICKLKNHPTAEQIIVAIRKQHPSISQATVYKVLDFLVEQELIIRVKNDAGILRYDAYLESHHHLYCDETQRIEDFEDEKLTQLLNSYFAKHKIQHFTIKDIKLQITGKFTKPYKTIRK